MAEFNRQMFAATTQADLLPFSVSPLYVLNFGIHRNKETKPYHWHTRKQLYK